MNKAKYKRAKPCSIQKKKLHEINNKRLLLCSDILRANQPKQPSIFNEVAGWIEGCILGSQSWLASPSSDHPRHGLSPSACSDSSPEPRCSCHNLITNITHNQIKFGRFSYCNLYLHRIIEFFAGPRHSPNEVKPNSGRVSSTNGSII